MGTRGHVFIFYFEIVNLMKLNGLVWVFFFIFYFTPIWFGYSLFIIKQRYEKKSNLNDSDN